MGKLYLLPSQLDNYSRSSTVPANWVQIGSDGVQIIGLTEPLKRNTSILGVIHKRRPHRQRGGEVMSSEKLIFFCGGALQPPPPPVEMGTPPHTSKPGPLRISGYAADIFCGTATAGAVNIPLWYLDVPLSVL